MKRILIISDNLVDQINGVAITFKNIKIQAELNGYSVYYIDPSYFNHIAAPGYPEVKLSWPINLSEKIQLIKPTFIHICTEGPLGLAGKLYCDTNNLKYSTSYHTKFPEFLNKNYGIPKNITYNYLRWFHKKSSKVLATTTTVVNELYNKNFVGDIVPWTRGVDRHLLTPTKHKHHYDKNIILYVGRVSKEKNLIELCELSENKNYHIRIVGDGPQRSDLESKYPNVEFLGYLHGSDLANQYVDADVFCFPSKLDTFGIVIIEAMSLGCPVAAYPVTGPIDIIEQGINGYMDNNLNTAIQKCLTINRHHVYESSTKWSWENCWEIFENNLIHV